MRSRWLRSSSSSCCPTTLRSVVCASKNVALEKFATLTTASSGLTTRKYTTASTVTGTLSRVIISWRGTSNVTTLRSILTIRSTIGISRMTPGPLARSSRPSRNTTPRSYSRVIRTAADSNAKLATMTTIATGSAVPISSFLPRRVGCAHVEQEPADAHHADRLAGRDGGARGFGFPQLAQQEYHPLRRQLGARRSERADQRLAAGLNPPALRAHARADRKREERRRQRADRHDEREGDAQERLVLARQQQRAEDERRDAAGREHAVARHLDVGDEQDQREPDQQQSGDVHGHHGERGEREQQREPADDAGEDRARRVELENDPVDRDRHEDETDVRITQEREELLRHVHRDLHGSGIPRGEPARAGRRPDRPAVDLREQLALARRDEVDDVQPERLFGSDRFALPHGALRPRSVPPAPGGKSANLRSSVVRQLRHLGLVDAAAARAQGDGMRGAEMGRRRHRGDVR